MNDYSERMQEWEESRGIPKCLNSPKCTSYVLSEGTYCRDCDDELCDFPGCNTHVPEIGALCHACQDLVNSFDDDDF